MIQKKTSSPCSGRARRGCGGTWTSCLLDKTGTITLGNRQATAFFPASGVTESSAGRRGPSWRRWPTKDSGGPQHRPVLAKEKYQNPRARDRETPAATFVAFTAPDTYEAASNLNGRQVRKGASDAIEAHREESGAVTFSA